MGTAERIEGVRAQRQAGQQVATREPVPMVEQYAEEFGKVLPSHIKPGTFVRLAVGALRRDEQLLQVARKNPASLLSALLDAARLGLEPGTSEYYLTPRFGKDPGVLGIVGYQGEIELIYRAGAVSAVKAELVRENDRFDYQPSDQRPTHRVNWFGDRGAVLGAYAYAVMVDGGTSKVVVIGPEDIKRSMDASPTADKSFSPWHTDYGAMVLKTAVHRLAKWVPTSAEYRREQLRAVAEAVAPSAAPTVGSDWQGPVADVVDAEIVDPATGEIVASEPADPSGTA